MKIFVGYGFNDRDKWVKDLVFPLLEAFGVEVITGTELRGDQITDAVRLKIRQSDTLIGFLTRRDPMDGAKWTTHRWVIEELVCAVENGLRIVEVREIGVDPQGGMAGDRQRIEFDEQHRDKCLVELAKTVGGWCRSGSIKRLKLLPQEVVNELRPLLSDPGMTCKYKFLAGSQEFEDCETKILRLSGGLCIDVKDIPDGQVLIQLCIQARGHSWSSDFEPIDLLNIHLQKD